MVDVGDKEHARIAALPSFTVGNEFYRVDPLTGRVWRHSDVIDRYMEYDAKELKDNPDYSRIVNDGLDLFAKRPKPKVVVLCGSSRFCQEMAVAAWFIERDERAIAMGLHLLPWWYSTEYIPDHLAEYEGVASAMDTLHLQKIDLADEIFVVDIGGYIGESTSRELKYAAYRGLPIRKYSEDAIGERIEQLKNDARVNDGEWIGLLRKTVVDALQQARYDIEGLLGDVEGDEDLFDNGVVRSLGRIDLNIEEFKTGKKP